MKKILILSANPINTKNLRLDEEVREIQAAWERALNREKFELINKGAVRIDELRRTLLDHKPQIVHFSGHGTGTNGLVLENNSGSAQIVSTESLSRFFELSKEQVECVLLNACYSETQAEAIFQHIDCVIGMGQSIPDNSAILFSKGFYDAIFGGRNYADAFQFGCNNIDLNNLSEFNTPTIKIRHRDFSPEDSITTQPYTPLFFIGTVVFGLIISLLGLFQLVHNNDSGLITHILLGFGLITFWLCCAYIYYPSSRIAGFNINFFRRFKQYKKLRRLALAGMVIIPLLGITGFYILELPTKNIIVLIADFETSAEQKNYGVTKRIFNKLDNAFQQSTDVKVQRLNKIITNRQDALSEGESHKARIVIWGDYDVTSTNTLLSPHFEVLQTPKGYLPTISSLEQTASISELNNFKLQLRLSTEMSYLTHFTVGLIRYTVSDWKQAITYFSEALEQGNDSNKALNQEIVYFYRGTSYFYKKDYDRAIADYNQAIKLDPNDAQAYNNRGISYFYKKDNNRAIADYNQAIKLDPNYAEAYNNRGNSYGNKKDDDRAIADYNQAIKLDPNLAQAYYNRGYSYANKKDYDGAIADYNQAIKLDPNYAHVYYNRGLSYFYKKDYDGAIADYNQAIKLDPNYAQAYNNRGNSYGNKKDDGRAIADYNQAIKLDPNYAQAYYNRGNLYGNKKDDGRAIADYNQAIKLDPNLAQAYYNRGLSYVNKKDYDRAIADYNQAIKLDPNYAEAYYNRGLSYFYKKDYDGAIADYNQAIKLDPNLAQAYYNRGLSYANKKDYDLAIADYNQAIKLDPNDADAYDSRCELYRIKKDYDRAIANCNQAIKLDPNLTDSYYNRGLVYKNKGNKDKAIQDLKKILQLNDDVELNQKAKQELKELSTK
ncbi:hypothetical protein DP114_31470 [Brasilonema sennae CENA114]|uniref:CHAT domain-containing protein n=1 Tax=Brasilonema sennae CENA114 TaxID=415709 RepID=A0A856MKB3_9CYAN|nr:tetratricopeptide repeat protein [Brasilonema sennae]QDL11815.1 hypothetical protein DP114_31470 [Brasilonema sennae CENA114]